MWSINPTIIKPMSRCVPHLAIIGDVRNCVFVIRMSMIEYGLSMLATKWHEDLVEQFQTESSRTQRNKKKSFSDVIEYRMKGY